MPMSGFIRRLKEGRFPSHVRFASIYSKADKVVPFPGGIIEQKDHPNLVNIDVPGVTHHEFLVRKNVYEHIRAQLDLAYTTTIRESTESPLENQLRVITGGKGA